MGFLSVLSALAEKQHAQHDTMAHVLVAMVRYVTWSIDQYEQFFFIARMF